MGLHYPVTRAINRLIERVYFRGLVFNQSWEDPVLDREALRIVPDQDAVLAITSGGCGALNLLCLRPRTLVCVDANPAQTYLLELKLAGIRHLDHADFYSLFGSSDPSAGATIYRTVLRSRLPADARRYWEANIRILERGILTQGKLGSFLQWFRRFLRLQVGEDRIRRFFQVTSLDEQRDFYYDEIHPRLWRGVAPGILRSRPMLALAGMHPSQYDLIEGQNGIDDYLRDRVEYVLTSLPIRDNYFIAQAALGTYMDAESVPPYLLAQNFATLKDTVDRVTNVTGWLSEYLRSRSAGSIDKLSLSDIFDWMDRETFSATMRGVVRVGSQGGRFTYRSTVRSLPLPLEVAGSVVAEDDLAGRLFAGDRSVTYGSFYVYRIDKSPATEASASTRG